MQHSLSTDKPVSITPATRSLATGLLQRKCACGGTAGPSGECAGCRRKKKPALSALPVQTRLDVGEPGDKYEQEADRVAGQVMRMALPGPVSAAPNRVEQGPTTDPLSRRSREGHAAGTPPAALRGVLASGGRPLPEGVRHYMQPRFGHDFSAVRVHTGPAANESAHALQAAAYTVGSHIVFGRGRYAPEQPGGRRLLAHELTHVIQQSGTSNRRDGGLVKQRAPRTKIHRTTVDVRDGCRGTQQEIEAAVIDARIGIGRIADAEAQECLREELDDATVVCDGDEGCGEAAYAGSTMYVYNWDGGCPSLPALLLHETSHKCKLFWSEEFAEACENEAFGGRGATPPGPGEGGGTCEL